MSYRTKKDATLPILILLAIVALAPLVGIGITRYFKGITLEQNLTGKLKQAADANGVPLAQKKLGECVEWLKDQNLTKGSTHVWIQTPDCDLEFYYENLVSAHQDLSTFPQLSAEADDEQKTKYDLAESNQLMKLRETLLDDGGEGGAEVTCPPNLAVYPSQMFWWWLWPLSLGWIVIVAIFRFINWEWQ